MKRIIILIIGFVLSVNCSFAQETYKEKKVTTIDTVYEGGDNYKLANVKDIDMHGAPKNVILLIGDGMGVAHVSAGLAANGGNLNLQNMKVGGLVKTQPLDKYITDSAAAGTALATGTKTNNGKIGVDKDNKPLVNIREECEANGLATGVVSTSAITHATPASFVAHQLKRSMYEEIAADFLKTDIDVFIGGGMKHFTKRKDKRNLVDELTEKGYVVYDNIDDIGRNPKGKIACLTASEHNPSIGKKRGDMLLDATAVALDVLDNNKKGFFVMIEGSQIDWGGHKKNADYIVEEMLDFDKAVGIALKFASKNKETLVIVTSDHETGGVAVEDKNMEENKLKMDFTTTHHTGEMVPIFAYGPGAYCFGGIMDNTEIPNKIRELLDL